MPIRILIVDDHPVVRDGLKALLDDEPALEVVATASDGREAIRCATELRLDVVLMDIGMPGLNGIEATREIRKRCPDTKVIVLSIYGSSQHVYHALRAGAHGYLLKDSDIADIVATIHNVHSGRGGAGRAIPSHIAAELSVKTEGLKSPIDRLNTRERQILQLIVEGATSARVAEALSLSVKTVDSYRSRMMHKLAIDNLPALVKFAIKHGLTSPAVRTSRSRSRNSRAHTKSRT